MKKKILALVCALALAVGLVGCSLSTPSIVGKIGSYEVTSGMYLMAQFGAYQQAAQYASDEQDSTNVKAFLKQTITLDAETGETALVSDYVADKTIEALRTYAAIDTRFQEMGGELTDVHLALAERYAEQIMELYGDVYTANGIGAETLKQFQCLQLKNTMLLDLCYGETGSTPVSDAELVEHLNSQMYEIAYISIPLYNTSTFVMASEEQVAQMLEMAQKVADTYNKNKPAEAGSQITSFGSYANVSLSSIFAVLGSEVSSASTLQRDLLGESDLIDAFTTEGSADTIRGLEFGEAAAFQYSDYAIMMAVRVDPLGVSTLSEIRSEILSDCMGDTLTEELLASGAAMANELNASAMKKLPATKIVLN